VEKPHVHTSNVPEGLQPQVLSLLEKHRALWSGHLGSIKATQHRIELNPGSKPVRLNPYRMGPRTRELIKAQVDRMLKLEVIEPSQSEWASPVVLIPKPDGSPWFCIDYRSAVERAQSTRIVSFTLDGRLYRLLRGSPVLLHVGLKRRVLGNPHSRGG